MPYIGNEVGNRFVASKAASVYSGDGSTTAFTLEHSVGSDEDILVSVDGVIQEPSVAYAVSSGTTLTFTAAPSTNSGNNIFVYYLFKTVGTIDHPATSALSATSGTFSTDLTVSGNTGIGETSPLGKLHIKSGDSGASSVNANANELVIENSDYTGMTILGENESNICFGDNEDPDVGRIEYHHSDNSMRFMTNTNNAMHIDSTGAITKPNQPAFLVRPASTQSNIALNTANTVVFGTEIFDQNADFASNTFTAPVTGKYLLAYSLYVTTLDTAANYYESYLNTSNRIYYSTIDPGFGGADFSYFSFNITAIADMDANDTVDVKFYQSVGTAQTDISASSHFSGALLC